jgi:hypothetical protein
MPLSRGERSISRPISWASHFEKSISERNTDADFSCEILAAIPVRRAGER